MKRELIEPTYQFVVFAREALARAGRPTTRAEVAAVTGSHHNQIGLAERKVGGIGYELLLRWATAFRDAGLGDAILTVDGKGPRFTFTFPDTSRHEPPTAGEDPAARADRLTAAIRKHRAATGHEMCHENDEELWAVLGDGVSVDHTPPPWCEFMQRCAAYRASKGP